MGWFELPIPKNVQFYIAVVDYLIGVPVLIGVTLCLLRNRFLSLSSRNAVAVGIIGAGIIVPMTWLAWSSAMGGAVVASLLIVVTLVELVYCVRQSRRDNDTRCLDS